MGIKQVGVLLSATFLLGLGIGWILWAQSEPAHVPVSPSSVGVDRVDQPTTFDVPAARRDEFGEAVHRFELSLSQELYEQSFEHLTDLSLLASSVSQQSQARRLLAEYVERYSQALVAVNQFESLDQLLERVTLTWPQYSEYQLRLGKFRIQMGNGFAALSPLSQLTNHESYGAEARRLMEQIERSATVDASLETLPLTGRNGQFIVEAQIDGHFPIRLLVDTGAAITAIDVSVLRAAGYDLDGELQYFSTANGVVSAPVIAIGSLQLGSATIRELSVGALPLNMGDNVAGLLGMNFLRHYDFRIDQNNRTLILDRR